MTQMVPISLSTLRSHSIFIPPAQTSSEGWELDDSSEAEPALVGQRQGKLAMRDKDLLVAVGREIRMTTLGSGEGFEVRDGLVGQYKTLKSPHLTFQICQTVLNPAGRLLAVVGHHQLVILVLPKTGHATSVNSDVNCRSFIVDEFQHSPSSTNAISKVCWHPWGEGGNSLWVLTANGTLFEYDILQPQDPVQTFNLLPELSKHTPSRFSAADPLSQVATSFSFSIGDSSFGPLMVYVLIAIGDVFIMGPIMPLRSEIPASYLSSLKAYTEVRLRRLETPGESGQEGSAEHASQIGRVGLQAQWVDSLIRQVYVTEERRAKREEEDERLATPSKRGYRPLNESTRSRTGSDASLRPSFDRSCNPADGMICVHPPHLTESGGPAPGVQRSLLRQGPVVFSPAPEEDEEAEQVASDIFVFEAGLDGEDSNGLSSGNVLVAIAWSGGRVDVGVEMDSPEPRWISSRDPSPFVPVLPIVESIQLAESLGPAEDVVDAPTFVTDPLHKSVIYVQSISGMDSISVSPWASRLGEESELAASQVSRIVDRSGSSNESIIGSVAFCNISLGYGVLALTSSGQLAAVEMDLRISSSDTTNVEDAGKGSDPVDHEQLNNPSLLNTNPVNFDHLITSLRRPLNLRQSLSRLSTASKPIASISGEHLRTVGEISLLVQKRLDAIRSASNIVEERLDLQIKEYARQLSDLKECRLGLEKLGSANSMARAEGMIIEQKTLSNRLDKILSALSAEYRPGIGTVERKWFDELDRLKSTVWGGGQVKKSKSLASRSQILKEQLAVVKPLIQAQIQHDSSEGTEEEYGSRQLKPLEDALSLRSSEIGKMLRKMDYLTAKLETVSLAEVNNDTSI